VTAKIFNDPRDNYTKRLLAATPHLLHSRLVDLLPPGRSPAVPGACRRDIRIGEFSLQRT
jgi:hypothetical protein